MNSFDSKEKYLKPHSLSDRQPVQLYKERSDMKQLVSLAAEFEPIAVF